MSHDSLPTWREVSQKKDAGVVLDPIEQFIYEEEPAGDGDRDWRKRFQEALYYWSGAKHGSGS